jgi:hypothetical protein
MNRYTKALLAIFIIALLAGVALIWWPSPEKVQPEQLPVAAFPVPPPGASEAAPGVPASAPSILHPVDAIQTAPAPLEMTLPALDGSDHVVRNALLDLITAKDMLQFLQLDQFVRHVVATVDNLPREHAPVMQWPVKPMPGRFSTGAGDDSHPLGPTTIHPDNSARYQSFVSFIASIDSARAVALYVRLYPLFQQAYVELGFPNGYFNDRLVAVIDHLLQVPVQAGLLAVSRVEVKGPYKNVRPWVNYEFTDPALDALSAGQKILLRAGPVNHRRLRTKLMDIRAHLTQTALAKPVDPTPQ